MIVFLNISVCSVSFASGTRIIVKLKHKRYLTDGGLKLDGRPEHDGTVSAIKFDVHPGSHEVSVDQVYFMSKGSKKHLKSKSKTVKVKAGQTKTISFK